MRQHIIFSKYFLFCGEQITANMLFAFSKKKLASDRKSCIAKLVLILIVTSLTNSMPLPPPSHVNNLSSEDEPGFSTLPKVLEIQLPLKIATKDDLVAWARYVTSLMASRINITLSTLKDAPPEQPDRIRDSNRHDSQSRTSSSAKNRLKESKTNSNFQQTKPENLNKLKQPLTVLHAPLVGQNILQPYLADFTTFETGRPFEEKPNDLFQNVDVLSITPSGSFFPVPLKTDTATYFDQDSLAKFLFNANLIQTNSTGSTDAKPPRLEQNTKSPGPFNHEVQNLSGIKINDVTLRINNTAKPFFTFPFEAVVTITRDGAESAAKQRVTSSTTTPKPEKVEGDYFMLFERNPPDEFPPYFKKNYTLVNEAGRVNVVFDDLAEENTTKKPSKTDSSKKRQSTISELLKMLGVLRKASKNKTVIDVPPPVSKVLKGTPPQKVQVVMETKQSEGRVRRNDTHAAQEFDDDDDDDDDDDEEEGGSLQAIVDLLPLVVPILEDLSDPETDTDIVELLQAGIPLLEGLSEPDEDGNVPFDIPGVLVPVLVRILEGPDGQGSDAAAVFGPLIQLVGPLIGPLVGPLIGPLSRMVTKGPGEGGSDITSLIKAVAAPLSLPGPDGVSPVASIIAGVITKLSEEVDTGGYGGYGPQNNGYGPPSYGKKGSDAKGLIQTLVAGTIAGTSSGLSMASKKPQQDNSYAPTSYGNYGGYGAGVPANSVNPFDLLGMSIKDILGAGVKALTAVVSAVTGVLGASSKGPSDSYGPPAGYGPPSSYSPPAANAPYAGRRPAAQQTQRNTPNRRH